MCPLPLWPLALWVKRRWNKWKIKRLKMIKQVVFFEGPYVRLSIVLQIHNVAAIEWDLSNTHLYAPDKSHKCSIRFMSEKHAGHGKTLRPLLHVCNACVITTAQQKIVKSITEMRYLHVCVNARVSISFRTVSVFLRMTD